jgi:hypothetical protein
MWQWLTGSDGADQWVAAVATPAAPSPAGSVGDGEGGVEQTGAPAPAGVETELKRSSGQTWVITEA